jgi:elongation factor P
MISVTELRAGKTFKEEGQPYLVLKYEHTKMGRGTANVKVRVRNLKTGSVTEKSFISGAKVEEISTRKHKLQYLYKDVAETHFALSSFPFRQNYLESRKISLRKEPG